MEYLRPEVRGVGRNEETLIATPDNTAVITVLAYGDETNMPITAKFMQASCARLGIPLNIFLRGEVVPKTEHFDCFNLKVTRLMPHIETLPYHFKYILFADARDTLFIRPLSAICDDYNRIGWPILIQSERHCGPHRDPAWAARFKRHNSGFDFVNSGLWMAERDTLTAAFEKLKELYELVGQGRIESSHPPHLNNHDQHMWQVAHAEEAFPLRLDFKQEVFCTMQQTDFEAFDYGKSEEATPIVLKNGSTPSILHFPSDSANYLPYIAWLLNVVEAGKLP